MRRFTWPIFIGFVTVMMVVLPLKLAWMLIAYFDTFWNSILWQPFFGKSIPLGGFLLSLVIFYAIGKASEKNWGIWLREYLADHIPIFGRLLSAFNPKTQRVLERANGFIIARYLSEWRLAKLMQVLPTKDGYFGVAAYLTVPPTPQLIPEDSPIYVLGEEDGSYSVIPTEIALKLELSGGTAVSEDCLKNAVKITLGEFIRSKNLDK